MKDQELKDSQLKLHNIIRKDLFKFVKTKCAAVIKVAEVKQTTYEEIESKITDEATLQAIRDEQAAYKENEAKFIAEAEAAAARHAEMQNIMEEKIK